MKYFIILFGFYLFNACGCFEYNRGEGNPPQPKLLKKFTIVNRTDKTYTNNGLYFSEAYKHKGTWKFYYRTKSSESFQKIKTIKANETINKNEKNNDLEFKGYHLCFSELEEEDDSEKLFFLLSLDSGNRKVFFGANNYLYKKIWKANESDCKNYYTWDIEPVWQDKELTITIEKDGKIIFDDPKIKEVEKVTASKSKEEIELKNLEIVPCDEE